ncbi:hypothetical protein [Maridesulfovibrio frigidus]|uniref:hypothetical protein n=1 Tax=Maridesulfovibrio frigidus TaxID=340956 RepID=UPI0004E1008D|nr:hypothetical protein [Maridesulfovibrio frigidus]
MRIASQGINIYAENGRNELAKTENTSESVQARVKTRSFGFSLGKFGVNFTAKDLEFEPSEAESSSQAFRSNAYPRAQSEEQHVQDVAKYLSQTQITRSEDSTTSIPGNSSYRLSRAISAYSEQSGALNHSLPGSVLGKV